MEELQLAVTGSRVDQRNYGLWINNWQIGQTLNALVTNQLPSGDLVLRVGGQQITATSDIPIQQGAQLQLEVKQLEPTPTLRILNAAAGAQGASQAAGLDATLRILPGIASDGSTTPLAGLFQTLQTAQASQPLPPPLAASIDSLLRLAGRPERLADAEGLRQAIRGSGIFLEAKLGDGAGQRESAPGAAGGVARDVKAGMLRAMARADGALKEVASTSLNANQAAADALSDLRRELESSVSRVTLHQVASQPSEGQQRSWHLEIPVQWMGGFHTIQLSIDADERGAQASPTGTGEDGEPWRVDLRIDPPELGTVELGLRVDEKRVKLDVAASREETRRLLDGSLGVLKAGLASRGLALETTPARRLEVDTAMAPGVAPRRLDLRI